MGERAREHKYFTLWRKPYKETGLSYEQYAFQQVREEGREIEDVAEEIGCRPEALKSKLANNKGEGSPAKAEPEKAEVPMDVSYLLKQNDRLNKALQQSKVKDGIIRQAFMDAVQALPPVSPLPDVRVRNIAGDHAEYKPHVIVAPVFDAQIGTFILPELVAGLSKMDFEEFLNRLNIWTEKVIQLTNLHRNSYDCDVLEIPFGGDMVEGEQIFMGQPHTIDMGVREQALKGASAFAWALRNLVESGRFKTIRCRCIPGNHGRPGKKGENNQMSNWDYTFYDYLEFALQNVTQIEFYRSASSFMAYTIPEAPNFLWLLMHGDNIKSSFSIPYYGLDRAVRNMAMVAGMTFDYTLVGHHHRQAAMDGVRGMQYMSGNWVGGSGFAINELQTAGHAKQIFLVVHPENGVVASHDIYLWRMKPMAADRAGIYTTVQDRLLALPPVMDQPLQMAA